MKLGLVLLLSVFATGYAGAQQTDYPVQPVPFTAVRLEDDFWRPRQETNRTVTIPSAFRKCEETGRVRNFSLASQVNDGSLRSGKFCTRFPFDDSDLFKVIEGASYSLSVRKDPDLDRYLDSLALLIAGAQEKDGYLYTNRTIDPAHTHEWAGKERWVNDRMKLSHELYNVGHFYEAAVAHYAATGKRSLLDVAIRNADLLCRTFGPGKLRSAPGHEEVEIGLVKLYRITGRKEYLDLARFFIDQRGRLEPRGDSYNQDSIPVVDQTTAMGHAVRAAYLYAGVADVAALTGEPSYVRAVDRIWDDVASSRLYITGGIGARRSGEAFGDPYELPNGTAYNETCAAIANVFWNQRMFLLHGDSRYIDVLERSLYNNVLAGISLDGRKFFYPNPLEADGKTKFNMGAADRQEWFDCSCCPGNLVRFLSSVSGYLYAVSGRTVYANLFAGSEAAVIVGKDTVRLVEETRYPWDGGVRWTVRPGRPVRFALHLRVPGWIGDRPFAGGLYRCAEPPEAPFTLSVNGKSVAPRTEKGYAVIEREWREGDQVEYGLPMSVRKIVARKEVRDDLNKLCLERGPIVFCAEEADNGASVRALAIRRTAAFKAAFHPDLLNGVVVLSGEASSTGHENSAGHPLTAIPYYAWSNRGAGAMTVWFRETAD